MAKKKKKVKFMAIFGIALLVLIVLGIMIGAVSMFTTQTIMFGAYEYEWLVPPKQEKIDAICAGTDTEFQLTETTFSIDITSSGEKYYGNYYNAFKSEIAKLPDSAIVCNIESVNGELWNTQIPDAILGYYGAGDCPHFDRFVVNGRPCYKNSILDDFCIRERQPDQMGDDPRTESIRASCDGVPADESDVVPVFVDAMDMTVKVTYALPTNNIPDSPHVRDFSCPLIGTTSVGNVGRMMATETFGAGTEVNLYSFRYPVNFFCNRHPVIVTSGNDGATWNNWEIYEDLINGETYKTPLDETHTFFYVIYANEQLPISCERGTFDPEKAECVWTPGIVHICSEGNFDPSLGLCVAHPEAIQQCVAGRYDISLAKCVWNPPLQAVCPDEDGDGKPDGIYSVDDEKCIYSPPVAYECLSSAYTYNPSTDKCEIYPIKKVICPPSYIYNQNTDRCERDADVTEFCYGGGIFNPSTGRCEVVVDETQPVCKVGILNEDRTVCIYEPDFETYCPHGSYNAATDTCRVEPDLEYLCIVGDYDEDLNKCTIEPEELIVCREDYTYDEDLDMCTRAPEEQLTAIDGIFDWFMELFASLFNLFKF